MLGTLMNTYHVYTARISPTLNGSSALEHLERSNVINGIMFNFYPGLPHEYVANTGLSYFHVNKISSDSSVVLEHSRRGCVVPCAVAIATENKAARSHQ